MSPEKARLILLAEEIRIHIRHYLDADTAKAANLTVADLRQVASGHYPLQEWQLLSLAKHMRLDMEQAV